MKAILFYSGIAFLTTLTGSFLPFYKEAWAKRHLWRLLAFSSGVLLGIAFLHLLPEAFSLSSHLAGMTLLLTFAFLFAAENVTMVHACEDFLKPPTSAVRPIGALVALALHAGVDGMAIGVGLQQNIVLGSVISFGVILHKFSDGMTLTSLLRAAGYPKRRELTLCLLLALATPLGALLSFHFSGPLPPKAIAVVLGIASGSFLYVGAADLLPRLHESHDRYCLFFFLLGISAVAIMP
jgi:zinc and cadmium transporter